MNYKVFWAFVTTMNVVVPCTKKMNITPKKLQKSKKRVSDLR